MYGMHTPNDNLRISTADDNSMCYNKRQALHLFTALFRWFENQAGFRDFAYSQAE